MTGRRRQSKPDTRGKGHSAGRLASEDEALWRHVTQNVEPSRFRPRVPDTDVSGVAVQSSRGEAQRADAGDVNKTGKAVKARQLDAPLARVMPPGRGSTPPPAGLHAIDHKSVRRLGNGRAAIDARVDLHGLRQSEAHGALRRFLFGAAQKGHRMVLVITGKGGRRPARVYDPASDVDFHDGGREGGVLRRQVPMWLREPEFQAIVVGFTTAHVRHGGDGALYVQLRRRK